MKSYPIQSSFTAGQLSWKFHSRADLAIHAEGLAVCENMLSDPRGPCYTRGGFDNVASISGYSDAQLIDWPYSKTKSYIVVLLDSVLKVFDAYVGTEVYSVASPFTAAMIHEVHAELAPGNRIMCLVHNDVAPQQLVFNPVVSSWTLSTITFTAPPTHWVAGNYPGTMAFGQGRGWFAGYPSNPQTIDASRSYTVGSTYFDMTVGSLATDGFTFDLSKKGTVAWIYEANNILVGTENSEHILTSSGLVIKPGDISHAEQSGYGSKEIKPIRLGYEVLYLSSDGTKLRSMWYQELIKNYVSQDITFLAGSEFSAPIKEFTLMVKPDMYIWAVLEDGTFASCSYNKESSDTPITGWHFHSISDGSVKSLRVVERGDSSLLMTAVHRDINGTSHIMLNRYNKDSLLDSREVINNASPSTAITGMTNFAGKTVQVLADGAVHPDVLIDTSGNATLGYEATVVELGFSFHQKIQTLPYLVVGPGGSNASWKKRPNKIGVRVHESGVPIINGKRPPDRSFDSIMDEPEPLRSNDIFSANQGFDNFGQVTIEQDLPVKLQIISILGEMQSSSL